MNEILSGVTGTRRLQAIVLAWFAPLILALFAGVVVLGPSYAGTRVADRVGVAIATLRVNPVVFMLIVGFAVSCILYLCRGHLFRLLTGEAWPNWLKDWRERRVYRPWVEYVHAVGKLNEARDALERVTSGERYRGPESQDELIALWTSGIGTAELEVRSAASALRRRDHDPSSLMARLPRRLRPILVPRFRKEFLPADFATGPYPVDANTAMPTAFGNALRAMTSWATHTWGLDSQVLWHELYGEASEPIRAAVDDQEQNTDTFMAAFYAALAFTSAAGVAALMELADGGAVLGPLTSAGVGALATLALYRALTASVDEWSAAVVGMINASRMAVLEKHGLRQPLSDAEEFEMWTLLTSVVAFGREPELMGQLDKYRVAESQQAGQAQGL